MINVSRFCFVVFLCVQSAFCMDITWNVLDVGQGNCTVFKQDTKALFYDCGHQSGNMIHCSRLTEKSATDFLQILSKITNVAFVVSHTDKDHCDLVGPLISFFDDLKNGGTMLAECNCKYKEKCKKFKKYKKLVENSHNVNIQVDINNYASSTSKFIASDNKLYFFYDASISSLTNEWTAGKDNDSSLVIKITRNQKSILLTGDATLKTMKKAFNSYNTNNNTSLTMAAWKSIIFSDVVAFLMPHHGSGTADSLSWCDCISYSNFPVSTIISSNPCVLDCIPTCNTISTLKKVYKKKTLNSDIISQYVLCCYFKAEKALLIKYPLKYNVFLTCHYNNGLCFNFSDVGVFGTSLYPLCNTTDTDFDNAFDSVFEYLVKLGNVFECENLVNTNIAKKQQLIEKLG